MQEDWQERIEERVHTDEKEIVSLDIMLDEESISHVGIRERNVFVNGYSMKVGSIGGVATQSEYRNRGLATRLMLNAIRKIDEDEGDVMFVSGDRGLYRRIGCVRGGNIRNFRMKRSDLERFDHADVEVLAYREDDLQDVVAAYESEPVRFHRTLDDFRYELESGEAIWRKARVFVVRKEGEFQSYVIVQEPEEGKMRVGNVAEYAGVRTAIVGAVKPIFEARELEQAVFHVPYHDREQIYLFRQGGLTVDGESLPGTIKIVNFPRLMQRLSGYVAERLGRERSALVKFDQGEDKAGISFEQQRFEIDNRALVALVFGTHDGREKEIMSEAEELAKILHVLFPLPFPWPGLDSY